MSEASFTRFGTAPKGAPNPKRRSEVGLQDRAEREHEAMMLNPARLRELRLAKKPARTAVPRFGRSPQAAALEANIAVSTKSPRKYHIQTQLQPTAADRSREGAEEAGEAEALEGETAKRKAAREQPTLKRRLATAKQEQTHGQKRPIPNGFILFDVLYQDGTQTSNRKVPAAKLGGLDGDCRPAPSSRCRTARSARCPECRADVSSRSRAGQVKAQIPRDLANPERLLPIASSSNVRLRSGPRGSHVIGWKSLSGDQTVHVLGGNLMQVLVVAVRASWPLPFPSSLSTQRRPRLRSRPWAASPAWSRSGHRRAEPLAYRQRSQWQLLLIKLGPDVQHREDQGQGASHHQLLEEVATSLQACRAAHQQGQRHLARRRMAEHWVEVTPTGDTDLSTVKVTGTVAAINHNKRTITFAEANGQHAILVDPSVSGLNQIQVGDSGAAGDARSPST